MYAIYINNIRIEFDGKISGKLYNSFFWEITSYSYPFILPLTRINKKAIDFNHLVEVSKNTNLIYFDAKIVTPYRTLLGKFKFISFTRKGVRLHFYEGFNFWDTIKKKTLNDLDLSLIYSFHEQSGRSYKEAAFAPLYNDTFADNFPLDIQLDPIINENTPSDYFANWISNNSKTYQAFPKLSVLVEKIFEYFDYKVTINGLSTEKNYKNFYIYYNFFPYKYTFRRDNVIRGEDVTNITFNNNEVTITRALGITPLNLGDWVKFYGLQGTIELNNKVARVTEVINAENFKIDIPAEGLSPFIYGGPDIGEFDTVKPYLQETATPATQKIFPDWTINKFFKELIKWGVAFFIDDATKTVKIKTFQQFFTNQKYTDITNLSGKISKITNPKYDSFNIRFKIDSTDEYSTENYKEISEEHVIKESVEDISNLPVVGEYNELRYVENANAYYLYKPHANAANSSWEFYSRGSISYQTEGDYQYIHEIEMYPLFKTSTYVDEIGKNANMVKIKQAINATFLEDRKDSPLRLFMYFGDQETGIEGVKYPLSTTDFMDHSNNPMQNDDGSLVCDIDMLKMTGTYGIYDKLLKDYIDWLISVRKDIKLPVDWPKKIIRKFDFSEKYMNNNVKYIVRCIPYTFDFGKNQTYFASTEMCKVR